MLECLNLVASAGTKCAEKEVVASRARNQTSVGAKATGLVHVY